MIIHVAILVDAVVTHQKIENGGLVESLDT